MIFRNHNNMLLNKYFLIIINVEHSRAAQYFCGNWYILFFMILRWIESSKEQRLLEIGIFCNIIKVFNVTFDQFNASLMNKIKRLNISTAKISLSAVAWYTVTLNTKWKH